MSKTNKVVLIFSAIALVCIIGVGVVVGVFFGGGRDFSSFSNIFGRNMTEVNESEALSLDGVSSLVIDCEAADIEFIDSEDAKVTLVGKTMTSNNIEDLLQIKKEGNVLRIESEINNQFFSWNTGYDMTVYLPADSMINLSIDCTSGDIIIDGMQFGDVEIDKTSGDIEIRGCDAKSMVLVSSSGSTRIEQSDLGSLRIDSISGNIDISDTLAAMTINSTSGGVDISGAQAALDIDSTSGGVKVDYKGADVAPITIKVTSGGVRLYFDENAAFDLKARVTSGNIDTDMDILVSGSLGKEIVGDTINGQCNGGGALVDITTTSGNIDILKK